MSQSLIAKMRAAREQNVEVGGFTFVVRRPTEMDMMEWGDRTMGREALRHVVGWSGVKESDVLANGDPEPLEYDAEIAEEWLTDRVDLLAPLTERVLGSFRDHVAKREAAEKN
jgi:DNA-binding LytR/AlgR family response regulator